MGELAEDWRAFNKYKKERRNKIEPSRVQHDTNALMAIGCRVGYNAYSKALFFEYKDIKGKIFPFSGWYSAKGIGSGRSIKELVKKLKERR